MARIRSLHPGQWTDEDYTALTPLAHLLAIALRTEADDGGVFPWRPRQLQLRLLPTYTLPVESEGGMDKVLATIAAAGIIKHYEVDGRAYGAIRNFGHFQNPRKPLRAHPREPWVDAYTGASADSSGPGGHDPDNGGDTGYGTGTAPVPYSSGTPSTTRFKGAPNDPRRRAAKPPPPVPPPASGSSPIHPDDVTCEGEFEQNQYVNGHEVPYSSRTGAEPVPHECGTRPAVGYGRVGSKEERKNPGPGDARQDARARENQGLDAGASPGEDARSRAKLREDVLRAGTTLIGERHSGSALVGRWIRIFGEADVLSVVALAINQRPADPRAWIEAGLRKRQQRKAPAVDPRRDPATMDLPG